MANPYSISGSGNEIQPAINIFGGGGGQNQYMGFPVSNTTPMSGAASTPTSAPGTVPGFPSYAGYPFGQAGYNNLNAQPGSVGAADKLPGGAGTTPTLDPLFTQDLDSYLRGQMGAGISPFSLSSYLPSTGGYTSPGQVSAPLTPLLSQLSQFLQTGQGGGAGANTLASLAANGGLSGILGSLAQTGGQTGALGQIGQTGGLTGNLGQFAASGMPTDVGPEWQAMVAAQQNNIGQSQANLKEQFASMGDLSSSSAANAMGLFNAQTTADQNSLLGQLQANASESAAGRQLGALQGGVQSQLASLLPSLATQLSAGQGGVGTELSAAGNLQGLGAQLGGTLQGLDQNSIQALMQEYFQTTPQENPLNNEMFGLGTSFAPTYTRQGGVGSGLIGSLPSMLGAGANAASAAGVGGAGGAIMDVLGAALGAV